MNDQTYDGPPDYRAVGTHGVFPETTHDQAERYNFLAHLNRHLAANVMPGVAGAYEARVAPNFEREHGRKPDNRKEVRKALAGEPLYQTWSALRRNTMEMRQRAGLSVVLPQLATLLEKTDRLTPDGRLQLDETLPIPDYLTAVDHHCMPGSYYTERTRNDVSAAANYDSGMFVTTGGMLGRYTDGGGRGVVDYLRRHYPEFGPRRILDLGCGLGHNVLPMAEAFPQATVTAVDAAAPMLRYGAARAASLGIDNLTFVQADCADLGRFANASFDWIQSTMFLHETSARALPRIMAECRRLIAPGGLVIHIEQPRYDDTMPPFEQAMRDWDAFNNNEPFWTRLHEIDLDQVMLDAGFELEELIHGGVAAVVDTDLFPSATDDEVEDYGRKPAWHITGARAAA
ncbi:MAG: class I SAM-dependent methyltransferase [Gammaproteobacteria bacterium]|nr:class I SAM-dependent methyltransferase [Gammaproteobacteria bacterium]